MKSAVCPEKAEKFHAATTGLVEDADEVKLKQPAGATTGRPE